MMSKDTADHTDANMMSVDTDSPNKAERKKGKMLTQKTLSDKSESKVSLSSKRSDKGSISPREGGKGGHMTNALITNMNAKVEQQANNLEFVQKRQEEFTEQLANVSAVLDEVRQAKDDQKQAASEFQDQLHGLKISTERIERDFINANEQNEYSLENLRHLQDIALQMHKDMKRAEDLNKKDLD